MKKTFKRFLSVFLAVVMVITVIPMGAYAAETEETKVVQVSELEDSKDLYSKTYETSEDTNVVISAAVPLHYEENGELKDIDNTLVKSETDSSVLTNTANAYNVELPNKYTDDSEIKLDYEDNSISFKLLNDVKSSKGDIAETEKADVDETDAESVAYAESNMDKLSSSITYENIMPDTDFEYDVQPDALKENIILNKVPDENYNIQYELNVGNLEAVLNDDNSISIIDNKKNKIFSIDAPYMIDAKENVSEDITVSLEKSEAGYILTYTPDYSWLSNKDTAYPVTIDPTITIYGIKNDIQNIEDTYVTNYFAYKNDNYSSEESIVIQNNESEETYGYYKFNNLPDLPSGSVITKSSFNVNLLCDIENDSNINNNIAIYTLQNDQSLEDDFINSVTWDNAIGNNPTAIDIDTSDGISGSWYNFDITTIVNKWIQNKTLDRVLMLKSLYESSEIELVSSDCVDEELIPYIVLEYVTVNGINDASKYHSQDISKAGTAYINDYTGSLTVERTDFISNGTIGDLTFYMGKDCNIPKNSFLGSNVSMNYFKTIKTDSLNDNSEYIITNGDGTIYYTSDLSQCSIECKNINETTSQIAVSYKENTNTITETFTSSNDTAGLNDNNQLTYVLTGYSCKKDNSSKTHQVNITYGRNHITNISDEISQYTFSYSVNKLYKIKQRTAITDGTIISSNANNSTKELTHYYTRSSGCEQTRYCEKNDVFFIENYFDENNNIIQIYNENRGYYKYVYNDNNQVIKVQEFDADDTAGNYLTFEYGNNTTTISDGKNTYTEYFDLAGNLESIVDQDGNATFAQYKDNLISKISETRNSARNIADFYGFESNKDSFFKTNDGTITVSSDVKFNGKSSVQLTAPAQTEAVFRNNISNLESNSTYTVSMWVKKDENTDCSLTLTNGDKSGIFSTVNSQESDGWQQFYCTINTEDSNLLNIALTINNIASTSNAVIYVDNMYVQKSPYLTNINLLQNGDFTDNLNNWVTESNDISITPENANISTDDNNRLKITGDYLSENSISQTVPITAKAKGTKYTYGGWVKSVDTLPEKEGTNREISLSVYGIASDGTVSLLDKTTYSSYLSNWQYIESELTLPNDNITQLKLVISNNYQTGYVMFDGLSLSQDELYTIEFEYDENNEIKSIKTNETTISLSEDSEGSETNEEDKTVVNTEYDDYGNIKKVTETATIDDISRNIVSKYQYGNKGSLLTKEMNELGRWIDYKYDYFGNVGSVTDANGNTVQYEYDNFQNLSAIINTFENKYVKNNDSQAETDSAEEYNLKVQYTYTGNRLDKIETGNIENDEFTVFNTYAFSYDKWGNQTDIYINNMNNSYIHYDYDENNYHQLNSVSYINGQKINYIYDDNGNIIYEYDSDDKDGDTLSYSYYYYDDGTCYGKKNLITGTIESYQDGLTTVKDSSGAILHVYGYDENGNLLEQIGNDYVNVNKTDNSISTTVTSDSNNKSTSIIATAYDDYGRVSTETLKIEGSSSTIEKRYTYYNNEQEFNDTLIDDFSSNLAELMGKEPVPIDEDASETNLIRYLTYYLVNGESRTKLTEFRYLYYVNGDTISYTVVVGGDNNIDPGNGNDELAELQIHAYNKSHMETGNVEGLSSDVSLIPNATSLISINRGGLLYHYDKQGNISRVTYNEEYPATPILDFTYDENSGTQIKNCLTNIAIHSDSETTMNLPISYDAMGNVNRIGISELFKNNTNPLLNNLDFKLNLNWSRGNTLNNISAESPNVFDQSLNQQVVSYEYDDDNLRTHKTINVSGLVGKIIGAENDTAIKADIDYIWRDGKLVGEKIKNAEGSVFKEGDTGYSGNYDYTLLYDQNDNAYGFVLNTDLVVGNNAYKKSETFYYLKDADNTIKGILDQNGNPLVYYTYDSYGKPTNIEHSTGYKFLAMTNPLLYRDYIYDIESGMYYLQSRYYAPYVGRFISADSVLDTGSGTAMCTNLYSYCENNPANNVDPTGNAYISNRSLRTTLKSILWGFGLNPLSAVAVVCLHVGLKALRNYIIIKATAVAGRFGALIHPAVAAFSAVLALVISGFSATTVARALIEGKGISITWARTKRGKIYGISISLK